MIDANQTNFEQEVIEASREIPVLVDFWAPWCGPCRALGPLLEKVERESAGQFRLVKVNSDENPELSAAFSVRSIPFVLLFRDGAPVDSFVGALPEGQIKAFLAKHLPRPGDDALAQARAAMGAGRREEAVEALRTALAVNPALDDARVDYVRALLQLGRAADARIAFEPLKARASADLKFAALALLIDAAEATAALPSEAAAREALEKAPDDLEARWQLAQWLMTRGRWQQAMDELLAIVSRDRKFREDAGRKGMLAVFELCEDASLVREYRRKLASGLY